VSVLSWSVPRQQPTMPFARDTIRQGDGTVAAVSLRQLRSHRAQCHLAIALSIDARVGSAARPSLRPDALSCRGRRAEASSAGGHRSSASVIFRTFAAQYPAPCNCCIHFVAAVAAEPRNTRCRAGASPYPDRTSTGWIRSGYPDAPLSFWTVSICMPV
jgi:hypothetical protein